MYHLLVFCFLSFCLDTCSGHLPVQPFLAPNLWLTLLSVSERSVEPYD